MAGRLLPLDALRGLAVLFMLEVHLGYWWAIELPEGDPLVALGTAFGGMAAPLFFTLAGAGLSLSKGSRPKDFLRWSMARGAVLLAAGFVFTLLTSAVYGPWGWGVLQSLGLSVMLCAAAMALGTGPALRAGMGIALMALAPLLRWAMGVPELLYSDQLMSVASFADCDQQALLSGFFPLVPWTGFMLLGTAAGELIMAMPATGGRQKGPVVTALLIPAILIAAGGALAARRDPLVFFPPSMAFSFLTCGISLGALILFCAGGQNRSFMKALGPIAPLGRLSLTAFVAHHFLGYSLASAAGLLHSFDLPAALAMVLLAWAIALIASFLWARADYRFSLEWAVRALERQSSK